MHTDDLAIGHSFSSNLQLLSGLYLMFFPPTAKLNCMFSVELN